MITQRASSAGSVAAKASRIAWSSAPRRCGLEIVSRATPGAGSSTNSCPLPWPAEPPPTLLEDNERVAFGDRLPFLHNDLLDHAGVLGLDRHLHLHRLEDHHCVAFVDSVADRDLDLPDRPRDVRFYVGHARKGRTTRGLVPNSGIRPVPQLDFAAAHRLGSTTRGDDGTEELVHQLVHAPSDGASPSGTDPASTP